MQRDDEFRRQFTQDVFIYNPEKVLFIDETGADRRNLRRKRGYIIRRKPAVSHSLFVRGEHISAVAVLSMRGILECKIVKGGITTDTFYSFVETYLLPHLMPFNGVNPNSVVILDNCIPQC